MLLEDDVPKMSIGYFDYIFFDSISYRSSLMLRETVLWFRIDFINDNKHKLIYCIIELKVGSESFEKPESNLGTQLVMSKQNWAERQLNCHNCHQFLIQNLRIHLLADSWNYKLCRSFLF